MERFVYISIFVIMGAAFLWFIYLFFSRLLTKIRRYRDRSWLLKSTGTGAPQKCPICSSKLYSNDKLETSIFPSVSESNDRIMHIKGCAYCMTGRAERYCPVCGAPLSDSDILVARIFERSRNRRSHVHVLGCSRCRKFGTM